MRFKKHILLLLAFMSFKVQAQDPSFTQFFVMPETLNPAFTGIYLAGYTGILHRIQWPDGNKRIDTDFGFVNGTITGEGESGMGLGLTILNQREVFTKYNYTQINGAYSYFDDLTDDWKFSLGLEAGYGRKNFNFSSLLLEDQININDGSVNGGTTDPGVLNSGDHIDFFDMSAGFLIYNDKAWFGSALKHLTKPNIAFTQYAKVPLEMLFSANAGYSFSLDEVGTFLFPEQTNLVVVGNYMNQNQYNRLDLGTVFDVKPIRFGVLGTSNLMPKDSNSHWLTSVNLYGAIKFDRLLFGYSYDVNTSGLGNSQGIHEFSLTWQIGRECVPCQVGTNPLVKRPWGRNYD